MIISKDKRWVYKRPGGKGDVEVYAETKLEAISIMVRHGYLGANENNVSIGRSKSVAPVSLDFEKKDNSK